MLIEPILWNGYFDYKYFNLICIDCGYKIKFCFTKRSYNSQHTLYCQQDSQIHHQQPQHAQLIIRRSIPAWFYLPQYWPFPSKHSRKYQERDNLNNRCSKSVTKVKNLQSSFLPERVIPYWNKLPSDVKNCSTVLSFKVRLEGFKKEMISKNSVSDFYFWNVSNEVLGKIEGPSFLSNKETHNEYLWFHPFVAKKRFVNLYSTGKY